MTRHFTVTLSGPGQVPGFIWVCHWCGEEAETPATKYTDIDADYQAHTCYAYAKWKARFWSAGPVVGARP